jgi:hypothetical protein
MKGIAWKVAVVSLAGERPVGPRVEVVREAVRRRRVRVRARRLPEAVSRVVPPDVALSV